MKENVVAIVQARMGSTRLPGKILKEVLGKSLFEHQIDRLKQSVLLDSIVIATTQNKNDDVIIEKAWHLNLPTSRGSEEDVLDRYYQAANDYKADHIVRITADCPLIDPEIIDNTISYYIDNLDKYDYVSNSLERTFPRGMDVEVFSASVLSEVHTLAKNENEREHVTLFIYNNPEQYRLGNLRNKEGDFSDLRLTVDTQEDFDLIKKIIEEMYSKNPRYRLNDIITLLKQHPEWLSINKHIKQKNI